MTPHLFHNFGDPTQPLERIAPMSNHHHTNPAKRRRVWPWVVGGTVAVFVAIGTMSGPSTPTQPTTTSPSPVLPAPATDGLGVGSYGDGMYEVGTEIQPGTYKTDGPTEQFGTKIPCYWAKYKNADGGFEALLSNDLVEGRATLNLKPGGYIEFTGGCIWTKK